MCLLIYLLIIDIFYSLLNSKNNIILELMIKFIRYLLKVVRDPCQKITKCF